MTANQAGSNVVLGMCRQSQESDLAFQERHAELVGLCEAAEGTVKSTIVQERAVPDGRTYLGSGKIEDLAAEAELHEADVVIFDAELTPAQVRNLEMVIPCRVIDRTQLILDIFANRARSKAGRLQVEIAQLQYLLPRLTGKGEAMSRLGGGIGTRGPGETKLETDRRRIRDRIARLRQDLRVLQRTRSVQRDKRKRSVPVVALVGYTNAGKTTLLERWTADRGGIPSAPGLNRLFDTLDPLARRVKSGSTRDIVLLDTVGFVQQLPHFLVEAFKSTLEEVVEADLIIHVVDGTSDASSRMSTTYDVLDKLGALKRPVLTFFNKMDQSESVPSPDLHAEATLAGSALTGVGMEALYRTVDKLLQMDPVTIVVEGLSMSGAFWQLVGSHGKVVQTSELEDGRIRLELQVERRHAAWIKERFQREEAAAQLPGIVDDVVDNKEAWF